MVLDCEIGKSPIVLVTAHMKLTQLLVVPRRLARFDLSLENCSCFSHDWRLRALQHLKHNQGFPRTHTVITHRGAGVGYATRYQTM